MIHLGHHRRVRQAMEALRPRLYQLAWSWLHDADRAGDLVQETCLRAMERAGQLKDPDRLLPWAVRIMANLYRDQFRSAREMEDVHALDLAAEGSVEERVAQAAVVDRVRAAIARLNPDQRMVLTLVDLMGMSYREAAEALDLPAGTVMSRLCRARARLKTLLEAPPARARGPAALRRVK